MKCPRCVGAGCKSCAGTGLDLAVDDPSLLDSTDEPWRPWFCSLFGCRMGLLLDRLTGGVAVPVRRWRFPVERPVVWVQAELFE